MLNVGTNGRILGRRLKIKFNKMKFDDVFDSLGKKRIKVIRISRHPER